MGFQRLDKENGLLISNEHSFKGAITHERITGELAKDSAWIVISSDYWKASKEYTYPQLVTGVLTVRVKNVALGGPVLNINLTNLKVYSVTGAITEKYQVKSTGIFERRLADKWK